MGFLGLPADEQASSRSHPGLGSQLWGAYAAVMAGVGQVCCDHSQVEAVLGLLLKLFSIHRELGQDEWWLVLKWPERGLSLEQPLLITEL